MIRFFKFDPTQSQHEACRPSYTITTMKAHRYARMMTPQPPSKECIMVHFPCRCDSGISTFCGNGGRETRLGTSLDHQTAMMSPRQKPHATNA
jgi:hypothetical protein